MSRYANRVALANMSILLSFTYATIEYVKIRTSFSTINRIHMNRAITRPQEANGDFLSSGLFRDIVEFCDAKMRLRNPTSSPFPQLGYKVSENVPAQTFAGGHVPVC